MGKCRPLFIPVRARHRGGQHPVWYLATAIHYIAFFLVVVARSSRGDFAICMSHRGCSGTKYLPTGWQYVVIPIPFRGLMLLCHPSCRASTNGHPLHCSAAPSSHHDVERFGLACLPAGAIMCPEHGNAPLCLEWEQRRYSRRPWIRLGQRSTGLSTWSLGYTIFANTEHRAMVRQGSDQLSQGFGEWDSSPRR